jgi:L-asparagine oxygenase
VLRLDLPGAVAAELHAKFERTAAVPNDVEALLAELLGVAALLPVELLARLLEFRASPRADGALLLRGLPLDHNLPPTPVDGCVAPYKEGRISECAILSVAVLLGEPVAYAAEKHGALVQDVFPTAAQRESPSNESSAAPLDFHTELTFSRDAPERPLHVASPDFVLLLGLRSPPERSARTLVIEARDLCSRLEDAVLAALRAPEFQLRAPHSFTRDGDGSRPWSPPGPLLRGPPGAPSLAFDAACGIRGLSPEADAALDALRAACNDEAAQVSVQLGPGDLLAINNTRCAHARSDYVAAFDGGDRWLQRVYVRHSIWPLEPARAGSFRVLA